MAFLANVRKVYMQCGDIINEYLYLLFNCLHFSNFIIVIIPARRAHKINDWKSPDIYLHIYYIRY